MKGLSQLEMERHMKKLKPKAIGKIANFNVTPDNDNLVWVDCYKNKPKTLYNRIMKGVIISLFNNQKSLSKVHGPLVGFKPGSETGKYSWCIKNILPPRKWNTDYKFEKFYEF